MKYSVAGVLVKDRKVLLARRLGSGEMDGRWELPGGKLEDGEDSPQALIREFLEEFGLAIEVGLHCGTAQFEHSGIAHQVSAFLIRAQGEISFLSEHSEVRWFSRQDLPPDGELVDSDADLLRQIRQQGIGF